MPNKTILAGAVSLLGMMAVSAPAFAGHCGAQGGPDCNMDVRVINDYAPIHDAMTVRSTPPGHHYRSIRFQGAPNVSITRVHGMLPNAMLSDAPTAFTDGCHPTSTQYCRTDMGTPVTVEMTAPPAPAYHAPAPVYHAPAPVVMVPKPAPKLRKWVGGGYDPAKFTPRQYGEFTFTPGTAYLPTSKVVRDPAAAQAVLDSGKTVPQSTTLGGQAPHMGMVRSDPQYSVILPGTHRQVQRSVILPGTHAPAMGSSMAYQGSAPRTILQQSPVPMAAQAPVMMGGNTYASNIGADGTYWEKTSGPTMFGNTMATQVICKRKVEQQVVNPVIGVPVPVPTPVQMPACETAHHSGQHSMHGGPVAMPGRWTR